MLSYANIASSYEVQFSDKSLNYIPQIKVDENKGILRIEGESYHEHAIEFFQPIFEWLQNFITTHPTQALTLEFKMTYFNTSTSRRFLEMFRIAEAHYKNGGNIVVNWYHEADDLDMLDSGLEYQQEVSFDFNIFAC